MSETTAVILGSDKDYIGSNSFNNKSMDLSSVKNVSTLTTKKYALVPNEIELESEYVTKVKVDDKSSIYSRGLNKVTPGRFKSPGPSSSSSFVKRTKPQTPTNTGIYIRNKNPGVCISTSTTSSVAASASSPFNTLKHTIGGGVGFKKPITPVRSRNNDGYNKGNEVKSVVQELQHLHEAPMTQYTNRYLSPTKHDNVSDNVTKNPGVNDYNRGRVSAEGGNKRSITPTNTHKRSITPTNTHKRSITPTNTQKRTITPIITPKRNRSPGVSQMRRFTIDGRRTPTPTYGGGRGANATTGPVNSSGPHRNNKRSTTPNFTSSGKKTPPASTRKYEPHRRVREDTAEEEIKKQGEVNSEEFTKKEGKRGSKSPSITRKSEGGGENQTIDCLNQRENVFNDMLTMQIASESEDYLRQREELRAKKQAELIVHIPGEADVKITKDNVTDGVVGKDSAKKDTSQANYMGNFEKVIVMKRSRSRGSSPVNFNNLIDSKYTENGAKNIYAKSACVSENKLLIDRENNNNLNLFDDNKHRGTNVIGGYLTGCVENQCEVVSKKQNERFFNEVENTNVLNVLVVEDRSLAEEGDDGTDCGINARLIDGLSSVDIVNNTKGRRSPKMENQLTNASFRNRYYKSRKVLVAEKENKVLEDILLNKIDFRTSSSPVSRSEIKREILCKTPLKGQSSSQLLNEVVNKSKKLQQSKISTVHNSLQERQIEASSQERNSSPSERDVVQGETDAIIHPDSYKISEVLSQNRLAVSGNDPHNLNEGANSISYRREFHTSASSPLVIKSSSHSISPRNFERHSSSKRNKILTNYYINGPSWSGTAIESVVINEGEVDKNTETSADEATLNEIEARIYAPMGREWLEKAREGSKEGIQEVCCKVDKEREDGANPLQGENKASSSTNISASTDSSPSRRVIKPYYSPVKARDVYNVNSIFGCNGVGNGSVPSLTNISDIYSNASSVNNNNINPVTRFSEAVAKSIIPLRQPTPKRVARAPIPFQNNSTEGDSVKVTKGAGDKGAPSSRELGYNAVFYMSPSSSSPPSSSSSPSHHNLKATGGASDVGVCGNTNHQRRRIGAGVVSRSAGGAVNCSSESVNNPRHPVNTPNRAATTATVAKSPSQTQISPGLRGSKSVMTGGIARVIKEYSNLGAKSYEVSSKSPPTKSFSKSPINFRGEATRVGGGVGERLVSEVSKGFKTPTKSSKSPVHSYSYSSSPSVISRGFNKGEDKAKDKLHSRDVIDKASSFSPLIPLNSPTDKIGAKDGGNSGSSEVANVKAIDNSPSTVKSSKFFVQSSPIVPLSPANTHKITETQVKQTRDLQDPDHPVVNPPQQEKKEKRRKKRDVSFLHRATSEETDREGDSGKDSTPKQSKSASSVPLTHTPNASNSFKKGMSILNKSKQKALTSSAVKDNKDNIAASSGGDKVEKSEFCNDTTSEDLEKSGKRFSYSNIRKIESASQLKGQRKASDIDLLKKKFIVKASSSHDLREKIRRSLNSTEDPSMVK